MHDAWELAYGLDPDEPSDGNAIGPSGYTRIEEYLNQLWRVTLQQNGNASSTAKDPRLKGCELYLGLFGPLQVHRSFATGSNVRVPVSIIPTKGTLGNVAALLLARIPSWSAL